MNYANKYLYLMQDKKTKQFKLRREFTNYTVETYVGPLTDFHEILVYFKNKYKNSWIDSKIGNMHGYLMTFENWKNSCDGGGFIDDDGHGTMLNGNYEPIGYSVYPSERETIADTIKYIMWYNK